MDIFPAVDIFEGEVVRLQQGDFSKKQVFSSDPQAQVAHWLAQGVKGVHVVDLNAAKGDGGNQNLIRAILSAYGSRVQLAGGIRSHQQAQAALELGAGRIVIGTAAASLEPWVLELLSMASSQVVVALDVKGRTVYVSGWQQPAKHNLTCLLAKLVNYGGRHFLITDIERDGMASGPNVSLYRDCILQYPKTNFIGSGGVNNATDLQALACIGISEVIVGLALYTGNIELTRRGEGNAD